MVLSSRRDGLDWMSGECSSESGEVLEQAAQRGCGCLFKAGLDVALGSLV